jgi:hypothetical protein
MEMPYLKAMPLAWLVECKTCCQRFAAKAREASSGKSTDQLAPNQPAGNFECPHCHEIHEYLTDDLIPGEGRVH